MPRRFVPIALLAVLLPLQALPTATAGPAADPPPTPNQPTAAKTFTLVTGDVVRVTGTGADRQVQVVTDVAPIGDVVVSTLNKDLYAVPTAVSELLAKGRLDPQLFNLSELDRSGYDDKSTPDLPLIATYTATSAGATARRSITAKTPAGVASTRALPAAGATALTMKRSARAAFFTGFAARAASSSYRALPTGVSKLWLDGKVKANNEESNALIGAGAVWQAGFDGTGQTIAVLDTGIDNNHPDLAGKVVASKSFVPGDPDPLKDEYGHGTHVASIALGTGAASQGRYAGTAKGAKLAIGKVLDDNGSGQWSWIIEGMAWAAQQAPTVNMSLGGQPTDGTDPVATALDEISARTGSLFVTAAGNWGPGYSNPYPFKVATPGSASRALAVGNGHHSFYLDASSSAGPAIGTLGLKPEIVAPGTEVIAARSADSKFRGLPDAPQYTSLTGTSMASPRVAGSVAVLRQQHPDWSAQRIEDAITSTSCTTACRNALGGHGVDANPQIYWRGAGGLDLQRASQQNLHGTGLLQFGVHSDPLPVDPTVSRTITYVNDGDSPVTLQLTSALQQPDANFTYNVQPYQAGPGLIDVPATVTVPAHGTTAVPIKIDLTKAPEGSVYGEIVASGGAAQVRSTLTWTRTTELHRMTIEYVGPDGEHGAPNRPTFGALTDLDNGTQRGVYFSNGHGYTTDFAGAQTDHPLLAAHRYSLLTFQGEQATGAYRAYNGSWTVGGVPDLVLNTDRTVTLDARLRKSWQVSTERPSVNAAPRAIELIRQAGTGDKQVSTSFSAGLQVADFPIYSIPGAAPATGTQYTRVVEHREAPAVTLRIGTESIVANRPVVDSLGGAFPAASMERLYDGGDGSPARLAGAAGQLVLADEIPKSTGRLVIDDVVAAAAQAKATGVLVAVRDGGVASRVLLHDPTIPVAVVTQAQAKSIRAGLANGRAVAWVRGGFPSPYTYDLVHTKPGGIGVDTTVAVRDRDLGVRRTSYHALDGAGGYRVTGDIRGEFGGLYWGYAGLVPNGLVRDDLATPGHTFSRAWNQLNKYAAFWIGLDSLERGQVVGTDVGAGRMVPAVSGYTTSVNGKLFLELGGADYVGSNSGIQLLQGTAASTFQVSGTSCQSPSICVLDAPGRYRLDYSATQQAVPLATKVSSSWTVNVTKAPDLKPVPQPIIDWNWSTAIGLTNTTPRHPYTLTVRPGYRPARPLAGPLPYPDDHGAFKVQLQVTYDDGATWVPAGTRTIDPGESGTFVVRPPQTSNGFVGYRITGNDEAGNALDQWVLRAAHTG
jgi:subtilisin family serine protease